MDELIKKAKKISILNLYKEPMKRSGKAFIGRCPFHDDNAPSFAYYEETNSWYCFTEGIGGDVIKYFMLINHLDFKTAIYKLNQL